MDAKLLQASADYTQINYFDVTVGLRELSISCSCMRLHAVSTQEEKKESY